MDAWNPSADCPLTVVGLNAKFIVWNWLFHRWDDSEYDPRR